MVSSMYFLAFAFLASSSLLFLLWHCRVARSRQQERRQLEVQDSEREGDSAMVALAGLTYLARGAPTFLIRQLPTHVFTRASPGGGAGGAGGGRKAPADGSADADLEMGAPRDQGPGQQQQRRSSGVPADPAADCGHSVGSQGDDGQECIICLCGYAEGETIKHLPCGHSYHAECIDVWLRKSATCPLCKHTLWDPVPMSVLPLYLELLTIRRQQEDMRLRLGAAGALAARAGGGAAGAPSPAADGGPSPSRAAAALGRYDGLAGGLPVSLPVAARAAAGDGGLWGHGQQQAWRDEVGTEQGTADQDQEEGEQQQQHEQQQQQQQQAQQQRHQHIQ